MSQSAVAASTAGERLGAQLEDLVLRRLESDELVLPVLNTNAARCMDIVQKPDYSVAKVAEILESDPILAARVLKVANSAASGARQPVTSVQAAVSRLGSRGVYSAVVEASTASVFESRDPRIVQATKGLWHHSCAVAQGSRDLSILMALPAPEEAYLAGLLHDVGKPVLAVLMLHAEKQLQSRSRVTWIDSGEWMKAIARSHRKVGVALATRWHLPEGVVKAISDSGDYDSADRRSVVNVVRFVNALAKQQGIYVGNVDAEDVGALIMIGRSLLELDDEAIKRVVATMQKVGAATPSK